MKEQGFDPLDYLLLIVVILIFGFIGVLIFLGIF